MRKIAIDLRRASTEFVVIVIGVLVALAVDQWRNENEDRRIEAEYLARIKEDLRTDIDAFHRLEKIFTIKFQTTRDLRDHPESDLLSKSPEELLQDLVSSGYVALPDSISTTFDELMSTGRFALIQSVNQRDALSRYYSGFEHISKIMFEPPGDYKKVLWESFPGQMLLRSQSGRETSSPQQIHEGLQKLLADPRLKTAANAEMIYADALSFYLSSSRRQAEELLELLEQSGEHR
jgi:hypothetical protein